MSFLRKSLSDPTVNGKLARAYDIHQYEHYQVHKKWISNTSFPHIGNSSPCNEG